MRIMPHAHRASRRRRLATVLATTLGVATLLVGCTTGAPPEETAENLTEVAEDPSPPEAAEELATENEPEPIVDPLECTNHLTVLARGTGEPPRRQLLSPVARAIAEGAPDDTETVNLDYPADGDIKEGATLGIRTLVDMLNQQAELCPEQQFVIMGYSQGALVIGEALIDPGLRLLGETVGTLSRAASEHIAAVVLYADPRFSASDPFSTDIVQLVNNGLLERPDGALEEFADRTISFCVPDDFICQASTSITLNEEGHVAYFSNGMQERGAIFALSQLGLPTEPENPATDPEEDR